MASVDDCRTALDVLASRLAAADPATRRTAIDRSLTCTVRDLGVVFAGQLHNGDLIDIHQVAASDSDTSPAQIRMTMTSDDLLGMVDGKLSMGTAWATGRVKIDASLRDLLKLRGMF